MLPRSFLDHILKDEALTRHLGDAEGRVLIEWLVDEAEKLDNRVPANQLAPEVERLRRRGRALARFVRLWSLEEDRGAALQLAGSERFHWPLPDGPVEACLLMQHVVTWESRVRRAA